MSLGHGASVARDELLVYLDAANTKSYSGSGTSWTDISNNQNDGTLTNGPTFSSDNQGVLVFDGSNDYVQTSFGSGHNPATNPISYSIWVNLTTAGNKMFLVQGNWGSAARAYFGVNSQRWAAGVQGSGWSGSQGSAMSINTWYFITIVFDGSKMKFYVNSEFDFEMSYTSYAFNQNLQIGGETHQSIYEWPGKISSVTVHEKALTVDEIEQNFIALKGRYGI